MARGGGIEKLLTIFLVLVMLYALYPVLAQQNSFLGLAFIILVLIMLLSFVLGSGRH